MAALGPLERFRESGADVALFVDVGTIEGV
jgi:hypothetical protein